MRSCVLRAFVRFVREGRGTPAPVAPTEELVVGGDYRFVRNPMYVGVVTAILGQALLFLDLWVLSYAVLAWAVMASFVRWYEEPVLRRAVRPAVRGVLPIRTGVDAQTSFIG